jgi:hypothetical protein
LNSMNSISSINALAQYINAENRAMAALAAAGAAGTGFAGGLHPAVEALDLSGLMGGCGPLSPDAGCSSVSSGLGDPTSWSTVVPVHLLPFMSQVCVGAVGLQKHARKTRDAGSDHQKCMQGSGLGSSSVSVCQHTAWK